MWLFALAAFAAEPDERQVVDIRLGHSVVVELAEKPLAVSVTDGTLVTAVRLGATMYQLQGHGIGTTDMVITYRGKGGVELVDLSVQRDLSPLERQIIEITRD